MQANFIAGIFSLLEQEVEPCGGRECSLERNWSPANGGNGLLRHIHSDPHSRSARIYGAPRVQAVETQPVVPQIDTAGWNWGPLGDAQQQHDVSLKLLRSWLFSP